MASKHSDDVRFGGDADNRPIDACPINVSLGAEVGAKEAIKSRYSEPCRYWNYIHPDKITSLQRGREGKGLNHHDEHLFIVVHQAFELWFKQVLFEVDWVRDTLVAMIQQGDVPSKVPVKLNSHEDVFEDYSMASILRLLVHRVRRADDILRIATHGFDAMETMEPMDFLEFRDYLIPASGFQSAQLRELEIVVGLPDDHRLKLNGQVYSQQFQTEKDDLTPILKRRLAQPSMRVALYKCLAHMDIPERDQFATRFLSEKKSQYDAKANQLSGKVDDFIAMQNKLTAFNRDASDKLYDEVTKSGSVLQIEAFLVEYGMDYHLSSRVGQLGLTLCKAAQKTPNADGTITDKEQFFRGLEAWHKQDTDMAIATLSHMKQSIADAQAEYQIIHDFFWSDELIDKESSIAPKTDSYTLGMMRRATLFLLSHPWTQPRDSSFECTEWSLLLSTVLKLEQAMLLWRSRHARMVELMIGRRTGTGGSSGVEYLDKTQIYRVYQDLWRIRALLVPASALK